MQDPLQLLVCVPQVLQVHLEGDWTAMRKYSVTNILLVSMYSNLSTISEISTTLKLATTKYLTCGKN